MWTYLFVSLVCIKYVRNTISCKDKDFKNNGILKYKNVLFQHSYSQCPCFNPKALGFNEKTHAYGLN